MKTLDVMLTLCKRKVRNTHTPYAEVKKKKERS